MEMCVCVCVFLFCMSMCAQQSHDCLLRVSPQCADACNTNSNTCNNGQGNVDSHMSLASNSRLLDMNVLALWQKNNDRIMKSSSVFIFFRSFIQSFIIGSPSMWINVYLKLFATCIDLLRCCVLESSLSARNINLIKYLFKTQCYI